MKFSRKLQKLFSHEGADSLVEHINRWRHPVSVREIMATIDSAAVAKLRKDFPGGPNSPRINRFADVPYWIRINVERAQDLWLDRAPPLRVLDLGCGAGYFLYVCRFLGHTVLGLDTDNEPLFRATTALLNVPRVIARIEPGVPLPDLGTRFDVVAAHRICFQRIGGKMEWTPKHWEFFIRDIRNRFLRPEGRLLLDFNPRRDGSSFFTPELRSFFLAQGARLFRSKALFAADPGKQPSFKRNKSGKQLKRRAVTGLKRIPEKTD
jgi:SAM-dependent methyltransferase